MEDSMTRPRLIMLCAAMLAIGAAGGGVLTTAATARPYQGHMWAALHDLQHALYELQVAVPNKGGHRVVAIRLTREAIAQVRAGIAFAR
jgi:hypothetical protein